jgi:cell division protein FtsN
MRVAPYVLAALLGVATSLLVACGGTNQHLIPVASADRLQSDFDRVAQAVAAGRCADASAAVQTAQSDFARLPTSLDQRLRRRLADGVDNLATRAPIQCSQQQTQTQTQPTTTETTPTTTTTTTTTQTTPTTTTTETTTTPTTTTPTTTTPTTTTGPTGGTGAGTGGAGAGGAGAGGAGAGGGAVPGGTGG